MYSVGGGLTADAAKYFAVKTGLPLVVIPTALSVDAFITAISGIRRDGCVYYVETKPPENLILNLDVIAAAPAVIRGAGGDTGCAGRIRPSRAVQPAGCGLPGQCGLKASNKRITAQSNRLTGPVLCGRWQSWAAYVFQLK